MRPSYESERERRQQVEAAWQRLKGNLFTCRQLSARISQAQCHLMQVVAVKVRDTLYKKHGAMVRIQKGRSLKWSEMRMLQHGLTDSLLTRFVACARCERCAEVGSEDVAVLRDIARSSLLWFEENAYKCQSGGVGKVEMRNRYKNL